MNFTKGNLVEVTRREDDDDPCGSWFAGNILSADDENYVVGYNPLMDLKGKQVVEKLQRKDVRPLPPSVNGKNWAVGDVAEVFDIQCWRVGKVVKVLKNNYRFVIKFFRSIQLKEFHASSLRIRQAWDRKKSIVIEKVAQSKDLTNNFTPKFPNRAGGLLFRTSLHLNRTPQFREKDREGMHKGGADNATMCMSIRAISKGYDHQSEECKINLIFGRTLGKRNHYLAIEAATTKLLREHILCSTRSLESTLDNSDAESSFPYSCGKRDLPLSYADKVVDIHELELRAYKSTVEALYASGPLTWEQEFLLTNLRLSLNISDEEHLLQLRQLLSAQVL